jgi:uncharacterized Tic20 family protein
MSDPNAQAPQDPNPGRQPQPPQQQQPYPPQQPYQQAASSAPPLTEMEDKQWASFAHLGGILSFLPSLIIWLVFKDRGRFTTDEAKEALNFQITLAIAYVVIWVLTAIISVLTFGLGAVFGLLAWLVWIAGVVFSILGFMKAKDGQHYRYPFAIRLIP